MNLLLFRAGQSLFLAIAISLFLSASTRADDAATTYKAKCAGCHGMDGKGTTPAGKAVGANDFASPEVQKMSDTDLAGIISTGKNKMPAYKMLKDQEIKDLVAYVREFGKK